MSVDVSGLHHVTIGCAPEDLPRLLDFYTNTIGLQEGYRPALRHPGHWLYAGGEAIVHLNALLPQSPPDRGPVDHFALNAHGLVATRALLRQVNIPFSEKPLDGTTLHQLFLQDPLGQTVELNFDMAVEGAAAGTG